MFAFRVSCAVYPVTQRSLPHQLLPLWSYKVQSPNPGAGATFHLYWYRALLMSIALARYRKSVWNVNLLSQKNGTTKNLNLVSNAPKQMMTVQTAFFSSTACVDKNSLGSVAASQHVTFNQYIVSEQTNKRLIIKMILMLNLL